MADESIPARVAVLEEIASTTKAALTEMRAESKTQFRWLLATIIIVLLSQAALWEQIGTIKGQYTGIGDRLTEITALLRQPAAGARQLPRAGG
jgi:hypothetical protein